ncbi:unnamed protein product [Paramecium primaurelia]|uniref:Adenylate kinase n=1 Tax=Paramecium primaurelia TaxID=5886 RepID=A0A8S1L3U5_PARPR|nr:unnamed protein product [Paramecium primaurelia]
MSLQTRSMERASGDKSQNCQQLRIFIEEMNSLIGSALVEEFRNDHENDFNPHIILGNGESLPRGATKLINTSDMIELGQVVLDCDIIIFHQNYCQAEYAFKLLKYGQYNSQKTFVLVSNPLTWSTTTLKEKKSEETAFRQSFLNEDELQLFKKYERFTENDLPNRRINFFERLKHLEQSILGCEKKELNTYVITPGLIYGNGEDILYELFKTVWMDPDAELPIYGEGNNIIPMIHVNDLASIVKKATILNPQDKYIFAVDYENMTQKKLITTIAKNIGNGKTKTVTSCSEKMLMMNVWLRPTQIFESDDQYIDANKNPIINWQFQEGFIKNIDKIRDQFKIYRGLDTVKLIVHGGPAAGKSYLCQQLSNYYRIPHIQIKKLIQELLDSPTKIGELVKTTLQQVKDQMVAEAFAVFEAEKKKKKVPKGQPEPIFDASTIVPRLPDSILIQAYQWRLEQNDAQNLGYVLDGFPKTLEQYELLFQNENNQVIENIKPKGVIYLDYSDDQLKEKAKQIIDQPRYTEDQINRRIINFRKSNDSLLQQYEKFDIKRINNPENAFDQAQEFITRNGPILVLQEKKEEEQFEIEVVQEDASPELQTIQQQESQQLQDKKIPTSQSQVQQSQLGVKKKGDQLNKSLNESRVSKEKQKLTDEQKFEQFKQQEKEQLDLRSQPLRQYLADNVVPYLAEALVVLCEKHPENPIHFLADFLEQKGNELQANGQIGQ